MIAGILGPRPFFCWSVIAAALPAVISVRAFRDMEPA
jgi:hypothetical protein